MYDWTVLNQTVSETLTGGRVGAPVFVRWTAAVAQNREELKPLLAEMSVYAGSWLGTGPRRLYATGSAGHGHLSLSLEYENGSSALLAISLSHDHPFMNLTVLGARGAIFHTDSEIFYPAQILAEGVDTGLSHSIDLPTSETLAAIEQSLSANQLVPLSPPGDQ